MTSKPHASGEETSQQDDRCEPLVQIHHMEAAKYGNWSNLLGYEAFWSPLLAAYRAIAKDRKDPEK